MWNFSASVQAMWQALLAISILFAITACNPFPKVNYAAGTLGTHLNPEFATFVTGCKIIDTAPQPQERDYIPSEFWDSAPQDARSAQTQLIAMADARLLFLFPFKEDEKTDARALVVRQSSIDG